MHPALSIVFFTTASGTGFALLFLLGLGAPLGLLPADPGFAFVALLAAALLAAGGLASSVLHLGRPERAWRAFSQWRSSWLSREGVLAVLTFLPAAVFGDRLGVLRRHRRVCRPLRHSRRCAGGRHGVCTGMIYASLKPIHQWHNRWVVPNYLALGLMGGALLLDSLVRFWVRHATGAARFALLAVIVAWWLKEAYWRFIATNSAPSTAASATLLGSSGRVRLLEPPHTQENYLLQEMGFRIARKHALRLRRIARLAAFVAPALLSFLGLFFAGCFGGLAGGAGGGERRSRPRRRALAVLRRGEHTVTLYYGAEAA